MSNIVCCIVFGFFIILGIVDVIKFIILNMFDFSKQSNEKLTIPSKVDSENIECIIRNIIIQNAWTENSDKTEIVPSDINEEAHRILYMLSKDYPHLKTKNHAYTIKA